MRADNGIEVEGLVREFKKGPRAVDGIDLVGRARARSTASSAPTAPASRPPCTCSPPCCPPTAGTARVAGHDIVKRGARGPRRDRRRPAGGGARPVPDRARAHAPAGRDARASPKAEAAAPRRRADRPRRALPRRPTARSAATRAACAGASTSRWRSSTSRASSSSTSRRPASTCRAAPRSGTRSSGSPPRTASPSSSPPSTSRRPTRSPTGSGSSTPARSSPRARPDALKAEIGRPTVEAAPLEEADRERMRAVLERFGSPERGRAAAHVAVRLDEGTAELADVVRALDAEGIAVADLEIHAPTLDDVFLAKTGRRLEGAGEEAEAARRAPASTRRSRRERRRPRRVRSAAPAARVSAGTLTQVGYLARRSITRTVRQPIMFVPSLVFPLFLLAVNSSGLERGDLPARLPDRLLPHLRARAHLHAGRAVRDHGRRPVDRRRHPARLLQPPAADAAARPGADRRPARRGHRSRA